MKPYDCLTSQEVAMVHRFYSFLRRLGAAGLMKTTTTQFSHSEFGKPIRYKLTFAGYDSSMVGKLTTDEKLSEMLFTLSPLEACIRQTE